MKTEAVAQKCSVRKGVLKSFAKFTCARVSFLIKLPEACNFTLKETMAQLLYLILQSL